ncbi:MAG: methyltransferase domain-containing protein [Dehalococcoidia bacterium]|nr:methyltransferase domain-containing protein [Dehalococcoidia bacterium]
MERISFVLVDSRGRIALTTLLVATVLFHYTTNSLPAAHYASVALGVAVVTLAIPRLSFWQACALSAGVATLLLGDAVWLGSVRDEAMLEIIPLSPLPLIVHATGVQTERRRRLNAPDRAEPYWDAVAKTTMGKYITDAEVTFLERSLERARPRLVVDAGAGTGRLTRVLAGLSDGVIATEVNPGLAAAAAGVAPNVDAVRVSGSSCAIPFRDGIADGVVCVEVPDLTHWRWFYRESRRLLRPGGVLIVTLQNRLSWKGVIARLLRWRYRTKPGPAYYRRSLGELVSLGRQAGLDFEDAVGFNWLPFSRTSDSPLVPALAKLEKALRLDRLVRISPWVIVRFRAADAPAGPDGQPD